MFDLLSDFVSGLTWQKILVGALIFLASFFINLGIVSAILVKLPADHFSKKRKTKFWAGPRPAIHAAKVIGKNIAGILLDFPGRHRLEQKLLSKPSIVNTINRLRKRFDKQPLQLN